YLQDNSNHNILLQSPIQEYVLPNPIYNSPISTHPVCFTSPMVTFHSQRQKCYRSQHQQHHTPQLFSSPKISACFSRLSFQPEYYPEPHYRCQTTQQQPNIYHSPSTGLKRQCQYQYEIGSPIKRHYVESPLSPLTNHLQLNTNIQNIKDGVVPSIRYIRTPVVLNTLRDDIQTLPPQTSLSDSVVPTQLVQHSAPTTPITSYSKQQFILDTSLPSSSSKLNNIQNVENLSMNSERRLRHNLEQKRSQQKIKDAFELLRLTLPEELVSTQTSLSPRSTMTRREIIDAATKYMQKLDMMLKIQQQ
ncbi:unnamed protein product, partial [Didymodactylos carnosus]